MAVAPRIDRRNLRDVTLSAGTTLKFDVAIIGEPPPTTEWRNGSGTLRPSKSVLIDSVDYNTKLTIRPVQRGDSGEYTITATNSSGKDTVTVLVTVTDIPSSPEGPLQGCDIALLDVLQVIRHPLVRYHTTCHKLIGGPINSVTSIGVISQ
uniref:(California timema) hypothetical protein n=1 Tax=Timema californicum TaxID=61474 RepID=A0A7R9P2D4_TIMCA|nr:unnamed protein product [Timema californicum]